MKLSHLSHQEFLNQFIIVSPLSKRKINRQMQRNPWWNTLRQNSSDSGKSFGPPSVGSLSRSDTQYRPPSSFSYRSASDTQSTTINVSHVSDTQSPTVLSVPPLSPCNSDGYLYHTFA
ncbi:hypothetical protein QE152_g35265 [Popillia japonica]|uniref:Uncharacterized protein n=1 Tax=Popillia japonica TaxID=7064 RepID=A0AAW1IGI1_POPJA